MERHTQQVQRVTARGVDLSDVNAVNAAFKADGSEFCDGCGNKAFTVWMFTNQQVRYPICEPHEDDFVAAMTRRYGGRTLVVPQKIYDNDIFD
jgi:hypothetical protein